MVRQSLGELEARCRVVGELGGSGRYHHQEQLGMRRERALLKSWLEFAGRVRGQIIPVTAVNAIRRPSPNARKT